MENALHLIPGQTYKVIKVFTDYDHHIHQTGEAWTFVRTNFLPYDDGLTLHVLQENSLTEVVYRFQWRQEEQAYIIEHFSEFVTVC